MPKQLALRFDDVPVSCTVQERYHAIAPCLAGLLTASERADALNLSYSTVHRWLREFRTSGMPGLFPAGHYPREPQTPERVIVLLVYYKCCIPSASDRELARVVSTMTEQHIHNETVKALLGRYPFWRHPEFRSVVRYPVPSDQHGRRLEMARLRDQGWTEKRIAQLLGCSRNTVMKWLRRARQAATQPDPRQDWLMDLSRAPHHTRRKVYLGTIHAVLELQKRFGYAGWFRIKGYLERDYGIHLSDWTIKKIMRLNRRVHLAPVRPVKIIIRDAREGPLPSQHPFEHCFLDLRYLDAKPEGKQLYSCLILEGLSRTILAGSLTGRQDLGVVLRLYYLALLQWGCWDVVVTDHGKVFESRAFGRVNRCLQIHHHEYEKGHPWQNLIESQFGIQARLGEYAWERCQSVDAAVEIHRELIRDHNRLPHFAHRKRNDSKHAPLEVLGSSRGREVDPATLHRAFSRMSWRRRTDANGFVRINRWKIYVEEGLPRTPIQVMYWDGRLRAEYNSYVLTEYRCKWDNSAQRPKAISQPKYLEHPFGSRQQNLFAPLWLRDPIQSEATTSIPQKKEIGGQQLRLYLGPELVR